MRLELTWISPWPSNMKHQLIQLRGQPFSGDYFFFRVKLEEPIGQIKKITEDLTVQCSISMKNHRHRRLMYCLDERLNCLTSFHEYWARLLGLVFIDKHRQNSFDILKVKRKTNKRLFDCQYSLSTIIIVFSRLSMSRSRWFFFGWLRTPLTDWLVLLEQFDVFQWKSSLFIEFEFISLTNSIFIQTRLAFFHRFISFTEQV